MKIKNGVTLVLLVFYDALKAPKSPPIGRQKASKRPPRAHKITHFVMFNIQKWKHLNLKIGRSPPLSHHFFLWKSSRPWSRSELLCSGSYTVLKFAVICPVNCFDLSWNLFWFVLKLVLDICPGICFDLSWSLLWFHRLSALSKQKTVWEGVHLIPCTHACVGIRLVCIVLRWSLLWIITPCACIDFHFILDKHLSNDISHSSKERNACSAKRTLEKNRKACADDGTV